MRNSHLQINKNSDIISPAFNGKGDKEPDKYDVIGHSDKKPENKEPSRLSSSDVDINCKCSSTEPQRQRAQTLTGGCTEPRVDESTYPSSLKNVLPEKPYASDKLMNGLQILPRTEALKKKYIELNPVHIRKFLTFDVDYNFTWLNAAKDFDIYEPFWTVINRKNGHAHLIYVLKTPVFCTEAAHLKPLKYLSAVVKAMTRKLKADPRYCGLISKNPFNNDAWDVRPPYWSMPREYELSELAECVVDEMHETPTKAVDEDIAGLGRNCYIFEHVRVRAYREIRNFWGKNYDEWHERVRYMCEEENANFSEPLGQSEINQIAKSITRWTLENITPKGYSEYQRNIIKLRWERDSLKNVGQELLRDGYSLEEVMNVLDVSRRTVFYWKKDLNTSILDKVIF